jgi:hypothetical protein
VAASVSETRNKVFTIPRLPIPGIETS